MQVVLLERVEKLGQIGDVVKVKDGFARNFLLPRHKALRATEDNIRIFESQRAQLEARNLEQRQEAEAVGGKLDGEAFVAIRQASESGQLYGSVSTRDIAGLLTDGGFSATRNQVVLPQPIKDLGLHEVKIQLHPEVAVTVTINVARSEEEAERQARGENVIAATDDFDDEDDDEFEDEEAGAFFEDGVTPESEAGEADAADPETGVEDPAEDDEDKA